MPNILLEGGYISLEMLCKNLSISYATGKIWVKLGKIVPEYTSEGMPFFSEDYLNELKKTIESTENGVLKSRRNKKYISGNSRYSSYISADSKNLKSLQAFLEKVEESAVELTPKAISTIIVYFARQMLAGFGCDFLVQDIIDNFGYSNSLIDKYPKLFQEELISEENEDILGFLYISLRNLDSRKSSGAYYTPTAIVKNLCKSLLQGKSLADKSVYDPCCGTGNFILHLPSGFWAENVYASDIDLMSVLIARINYALKFCVKDKDIIYSQVFQCDYLNTESKVKYDYIIGNPPWGVNFSDEEKSFLKKKYKSAVGANVESYDVVVEQALLDLADGGVLSFVLPEAFLTVKAHSPIRKYLMSNSSFKYIEYLGEVFDGVQCPSIIVQIQKNNKPFSTLGLVIKNSKREFVVSSERNVHPDCFNFLMDDQEYALIEKITSIESKITLKNRAEFALGIVTGDNKKYVSTLKTANNEVVLKGTDISKFKYTISGNYIDFKPNEFQQVAPVSSYRAKEKLFYKFISKKLVFAYDDKQTLSLNSCNILIPQIDELSIKYILAVLNSSVAQFFFEKQFNSIKVLRSHIEQIPIPFVGQNVQDEVVKLVDEIMSTDEKYDELFNILDRKIAKLYGLTESEILLIKS